MYSLKCIDEKRQSNVSDLVLSHFLDKITVQNSQWMLIRLRCRITIVATSG
jgi:hypothetical protein